MKIKKTALALGSALMLFSTTLTAQEQPWSFGAKVGPSWSWIRGLGDKKFGDGDSDTSGRLAFSGGLTAGYAFHENVGVGLEVLYAGLGGEAKEKLAAGEKNKKAQQFRIRTQNLVIPMMVKFFPMGCDPEEGILDLHIGLQGEIPLFGVTVEKSTKSDESKLEDDKNFKKEYLAPMTASIIAGVGYEFPEIGLTLESRYSFGFMDILKGEEEAKKYKEENGLKDKELSNQSLTVSLGYNFARLLMD
jgi:hypothetical protein